MHVKYSTFDGVLTAVKVIDALPIYDMHEDELMFFPVTGVDEKAIVESATVLGSYPQRCVDVSCNSQACADST